MCMRVWLASQRAELGECGKVHSVALKADFEEANMERDYRYEEEVLEHLRAFLKDNERKIETAKKRLTLVDENPEMESKVVSGEVCVCVWGGGHGHSTVIILSRECVEPLFLTAG